MANAGITPLAELTPVESPHVGQRVLAHVQRVLKGSKDPSRRYMQPRQFVGVITAIYPYKIMVRKDGGTRSVRVELSCIFEVPEEIEPAL